MAVSASKRRACSFYVLLIYPNHAGLQRQTITPILQAAKMKGKNYLHRNQSHKMRTFVILSDSSHEPLCLQLCYGIYVLFRANSAGARLQLWRDRWISSVKYKSSTGAHYALQNHLIVRLAERLKL